MLNILKRLFNGFVQRTAVEGILVEDILRNIQLLYFLQQDFNRTNDVYTLQATLKRREEVLNILDVDLNNLGNSKLIELSNNIMVPEGMQKFVNELKRRYPEFKDRKIYIP